MGDFGLPALSHLEALVQAARKRCHAPVELEAQQLRSHLLGGKSGARAERVHVHRIVAHELQQAPLRRRAGGRGFARPRYGGGKAARASTSSADSTSFAPALMRAWQPFDSGEWIEPGIANTSRP